jgi:hypothetical protein
LERIERRPKYKKAGEDDHGEDDDHAVEIVVASPQQTRRGFILQLQSDHDEQEMELQSLADIVLDEYPRALRDTDLFINVLNQFGIADNQQVRSRALEIVKEKQNDARASQLARKIAAAERRGEPESSVRFLRSSSGISEPDHSSARDLPSLSEISIDDSQDSVVLLSPKRRRLVEEACTRKATCSAPVPVAEVKDEDTVEVSEANLSTETSPEATSSAMFVSLQAVIEVADSQELVQHNLQSTSMHQSSSKSGTVDEQLTMAMEIVGLGFSEEQARQAAERYSSIGAAVDWIVRSLP